MARRSDRALAWTMAFVFTALAAAAVVLAKVPA